MKKYTYYVSILFFTFLSCRKDEPTWHQYYNGYAQALKNGINWNANVRAIYGSTYYDYGISIAFEVYNENDELRESLDFRFLRHCTCRYILDRNYSDSTLQCNYYKMSDDGDVLSSRYDVIGEEPDNFMNITVYDSLTGKLEGNFQVALVEDTSYNHHSIPDTLRFVNGVFSTLIQD